MQMNYRVSVNGTEAIAAFKLDSDASAFAEMLSNSMLTDDIHVRNLRISYMHDVWLGGVLVHTER